MGKQQAMQTHALHTPTPHTHSIKEVRKDDIAPQARTHARDLLPGGREGEGAHSDVR